MTDCTNHSVAECRVIEVLGDHGNVLRSVIEAMREPPEWQLSCDATES